MPYELRYSRKAVEGLTRMRPFDRAAVVDAIEQVHNEMAVERVSRSNKNVTALLSRAREEPVILRTEGAGDFAVLPLDDEVIDLLLERSPALKQECELIRERMKQGEYWTQEQMLAALRDTTPA